MSAQDEGFKAALSEAKQGASEGGVPIGACLVSAQGKILGRGHNMRMQKQSPTIHVCRRWSHSHDVVVFIPLHCIPYASDLSADQFELAPEGRSM